MPYEPVLPGTDLVVCTLCKTEGAGFVMPRRSAWHHDKVFHPEQVLEQPPVLQEAQAS
jgi:hypothetical protein